MLYVYVELIFAIVVEKLEILKDLMIIDALIVEIMVIL